MEDCVAILDILLHIIQHKNNTQNLYYYTVGLLSMALTMSYILDMAIVHIHGHKKHS